MYGQCHSQTEVHKTFYEKEHSFEKFYRKQGKISKSSQEPKDATVLIPPK